MDIHRSRANRQKTPHSVGQLVIQLAEMPLVMERALLDFGLHAAFRCRPAVHQDHYVHRVTTAKTDLGQRERIAEMLDELAGSQPVLGESIVGRDVALN
jgi:hypothetical protein